LIKTSLFNGIRKLLAWIKLAWVDWLDDVIDVSTPHLIQVVAPQFPKRWRRESVWGSLTELFSTGGISEGGKNATNIGQSSSWTPTTLNSHHVHGTSNLWGVTLGVIRAMKNSLQEQTDIFVNHGLRKAFHGIEVTVVTDVNTNRGGNTLKSTVPSVEEPDSLIVKWNPFMRVQLIHHVNR
jgi:hypothetical protein